MARYVYVIRVCLALAGAMTMGKCVAQFSDSVHYYFKFASTGIINKTETSDSYVMNNALNFNVKKKKLFLTSAASWVYGEQDEDLTNNDFSSFANLDYLKGIKRLYYWGLINYDKSFSLKITNRLQAGAGVAYDIINKKNGELVVSDGFMYEANDLVDDKLGPDKYQTVRNSLRLRYRIVVKDLIILDGSNFYQPSMKDFNDYVIKSTNTLSIKLRKWLSITVSETYNKVSRTERENLLLTFGLTVEKYF